MKKDGKISCNNEKEKLTPANVKKKKKKQLTNTKNYTIAKLRKT